MRISQRIVAAALGTSAVLYAGSLPLAAQEPAPSKPAPAARKKDNPSRRVPAYFGQIGLNTEQRASIYVVLGKHQEKIDALEKQIAAEKAAMIAECEGVLTDTQKKLLENLRNAAADPKAAGAPKPSN